MIPARKAATMPKRVFTLLIATAAALLVTAAPVSSFTALRNGFTEPMPHIKGMHAEAADDVWLNDWKIEMMIWVDNAGRSLAGSKHLGSAVISGQQARTRWPGVMSHLAPGDGVLRQI